MYLGLCWGWSVYNDRPQGGPSPPRVEGTGETEGLEASDLQGCECWESHAHAGKGVELVSRGGEEGESMHNSAGHAIKGGPLGVHARAG